MFSRKRLESPNNELRPVFKVVPTLGLNKQIAILVISTKIDNAGAIFIGKNSPEVFGDYCAGPNHVLPTSGSARYASPLGVYDFLKRTSLMKISPAHSRELSITASLLADCEGLTAHSQSAKLRK